MAGSLNLLEGFHEFGEAFADLFAIAREERDASGLAGIAAMQLCAHAVVFVFELCFAEGLLRRCFLKETQESDLLPATLRKRRCVRLRSLR